MQITLLGTGGPKPDPHRQGPCLSIQAKDRCLIFDTGRGAATQMAAANISLDRINRIFITHLHYDHIGNLGDVMLSGWNLGRKQPLVVYGPEGIKDVVQALLERVYKKDIEFRMTEASRTGVTLANIQDIIKVKEAGPGLVYEDDIFKVFCEYVSHGHGLGISQDTWKCLGYRVKAQGKSIAVSGDTVACQGIDTLAKNTDALVLCCYLSEKEQGNIESSFIAEHILACSPQVGKIAQKAGTGKLILTHIREKGKEETKNLAQEIKKDFSGQIIIGQDLLVIDV